MGHSDTDILNITPLRLSLARWHTNRISVAAHRNSLYTSLRNWQSANIVVDERIQQVSRWWSHGSLMWRRYCDWGGTARSGSNKLNVLLKWLQPAILRAAKWGENVQESEVSQCSQLHIGQYIFSPRMKLYWANWALRIFLFRRQLESRSASAMKPPSVNCLHTWQVEEKKTFMVPHYANLNATDNYCLHSYDCN